MRRAQKKQRGRPRYRSIPLVFRSFSLTVNFLLLRERYGVVLRLGEAFRCWSNSGKKAYGVRRMFGPRSARRLVPCLPPSA
jgi:hypothetical protein